MKNIIRDPTTKYTHELRTEVVDQLSGELLGGSTEKKGVVPKEPDYVKLYLADISYLSDLPKWANGILYELLTKMDYEGRIILNAGIKREIAAKLDTSVQNIENSISKFNKKNILIRQDTGIYTGNPWLFGKGEWKDIRQIRLSIGYNLDGTRDLKALIERAIEDGTTV
jgi:DNA primase catalytic subunit